MYLHLCAVHVLSCLAHFSYWLTKYYCRNFNAVGEFKANLEPMTRSHSLRILVPHVATAGSRLISGLPCLSSGISYVPGSLWLTGISPRAGGKMMKANRGVQLVFVFTCRWQICSAKYPIRQVFLMASSNEVTPPPYSHLCSWATTLFWWLCSTLLILH